MNSLSNGGRLWSRTEGLLPSEQPSPGPFCEHDLRLAINNFIEAPLEEIVKGVEKSGVIDKVGFNKVHRDENCAAGERVPGRGAQEDVGPRACLDSQDDRCHFEA